MEESEVPVKIVGAFLNSLFEDHTLPHRCRLSSPVVRPRSLTASLSLVQDFVQLLHFCPGYAQDGLIRVIIGLYNGVPESFEVFHCRSNTTEGELNLFLKRAAKFPLQYLILEVNKLPYKLQEVHTCACSTCTCACMCTYMYLYTIGASSPGPFLAVTFSIIIMDNCIVSSSPNT